MTGTCPNCGAPIVFGGAQSLAAVCGHCRTAVARAGADLTRIGKVPDLVATHSRMALNARGAIDGKAFTIIGHLQLGQVNGDALWDEWYALFADGSWGWLAEAQDRLLFTRQTTEHVRLPAFDSLKAGHAFQLLGTAIAVDEVNDARFVTAEGELPFEPHLNETYRFADCTDTAGGFYTIDYGSVRDAPMLFAGKELTYAGAGLGDVQPAAVNGPDGQALSCPSCGASIGLELSSSESASCPSCHALLDVSRQPARLIAQLQGRTRPSLALGTKGQIGGGDFQIIGWMKRSVHLDGIDYSWSEYLLHGPAGYRWLVESSGHWLFMEPVHAGKIFPLVEGKHATFEGRHYRHFQTAHARYDQIQGEFYWRIETGNLLETIDYIAPPYVLSCEHTVNEVNWSHGEYLTPAQVWAAFQLPGTPKAATGVAPAQPNPYQAGRAWKAAAIALAIIAVVAIGLSLRRPRQRVLQLEVAVATDAGEAVTLSEPFELSGGPQAVEIKARATVSQAWVGLDVALINDESGESDAVGFELSHYQGSEGGEAWSEGSRSGSAIIGSVPDGRYVLRVEPEWQRESNGILPKGATVSVDTGVFVKGPLYLAILLVLIWPSILLVRHSGFETRRWEESDHPHGGS